MKIIRGFSEHTSYNCSQCHHKCCGTEYELELLPKEKKQLEKYSIAETFLKEGFEEHSLLRGDACPFLDENGLCLLHDTKDPNEKPLLCWCYPLVYWKISAELILCWIVPCRGHGFEWVTGEERKITEEDIQELYSKLNPHFETFIGEYYDEENPYEDVLQQRVEEELQFINRDVALRQHDFLQATQDTINSSYLDRLIEPVQHDINHFKSNEHLDIAINAVFHWLCWSPVGLQLNFINAKYLFLVAATWVKSQCLKILHSKSNLNLSDNILIEQHANLLANAILPSFWEQVKSITSNEELMRFSQVVIEVLQGELPQEKMLL